MLCNSRIYLPEGFLLCVLDDVQFKDYLFQKAVVLLFAVLRGNPDILWCYKGVGVAVSDWQVSLCLGGPRPWHRPRLFGGGHPPLLCGQPGYLQGSTQKTIAPFDSTTSFQLRQTALGLSNGVQSVASLNHDLSLLFHSINIYLGDNNIYLVVFLWKVNKLI